MAREACPSKSSFHFRPSTLKQRRQLLGHFPAQVPKLLTLFRLEHRKIRFVITLGRVLLFEFLRLAQQLALHQIVHEMRGIGRFFDPRLNNAAKFPIAAANGFADLPHIPPDEDRITKKLPELHFYQLAIPAPAPEPGVDFDVCDAVRRGESLQHSLQFRFDGAGED
jgi:hypothetical protein